MINIKPQATIKRISNGPTALSLGPLHFHKRIMFFFMRDRRWFPMPGIHNSFIWQDVQLFQDAFVQLLFVTAGEVEPADTFIKQNIATYYKILLFAIQADARRRMPGC